MIVCVFPSPHLVKSYPFRVVCRFPTTRRRSCGYYSSNTCLAHPARGKDLGMRILPTSTKRKQHARGLCSCQPHMRCRRRTLLAPYSTARSHARHSAPGCQHPPSCRPSSPPRSVTCRHIRTLQNPLSFPFEKYHSIPHRRLQKLRNCESHVLTPSIRSEEADETPANAISSCHIICHAVLLELHTSLTLEG